MLISMCSGLYIIGQYFCANKPDPCFTVTSEYSLCVIIHALPYVRGIYDTFLLLSLTPTLPILPCTPPLPPPPATARLLPPYWADEVSLMPVSCSAVSGSLSSRPGPGSPGHYLFTARPGLQPIVGNIMGSRAM